MSRALSVSAFLALAVLGGATMAWAQEEGPPTPPLQQQPQAQPATQQLWPADQLDNLVAPIALYPDPLLGQILVACTYPLEVVEASQWLKRNRNLQGQALLDAAKQQPWDPSVQALVAVPDALEKLNQDIRWTTDLGNAFLAQQADVMSAVQRMRARALAKGRLSSTPQQTVTTEDQGGQKVIVIEPASPQVIYVPVYDPYYVWGPPVWGYYPPLYYPYFGFGFGTGFNLSFCFGNWGGWFGWGWGPNWFGHSVYVNNYFFDHYGFHHPYYGGGYRGGSYHGGGYHGDGYRGRAAWTHDPGHRKHVPYQNSQVASRYGAGSMGFRDSVSPGTGPGGSTSPYTNASRSGGRTASPVGQQAYRGTSPQADQLRNPGRQRYQSSQQYTASSQQYRAQPQTQASQNRSPGYQSLGQYRSEPQGQQSRNQAQQRYQTTQNYRPSSQQYRAEPQVQPSLSQPRSYQATREYRSAPQVQRYQSQPQSYQSWQQYRSAPQAQRFQSQAQPRYQAPQQYRSFTQQSRSAPQMSAPRFSSSPSFSRGSAGNFSRGGAGGSSRGGGSFSSGGGGNHRR
jgi:hypothetical protein